MPRFVTHEWHLCLTTGTVNRDDHGTRLTLANSAWVDANAWAPQTVQRNGLFCQQASLIGSTVTQSDL